jgi:predicted oxidoreductase
MGTGNRHFGDGSCVTHIGRSSDPSIKTGKPDGPAGRGEKPLITRGGLRRNSKYQVLDANRKPIPRLYSACELGTIYSWGYQGGGNILARSVFGRVSGERASAEKTWA